MLLAQISDLHISAQKPANLQQVAKLVNRLNSWQPHINAVLISGDLTDTGDIASYQQLFTHLKALNMPYFWVLGNHDIRTNAMSAADISTSPNSTAYNWLVSSYAVNLIGLDSLQEGQAGGYLSAESLNFLEQSLNQQPHKPTLVMLHHPPIDSGIAFMDGIKLENQHALEGIIMRHKQVIRLSCGHLHRHLHTTFAHTLISVCPSLAPPITLNLSPTEQDYGLQECAQFLLHHYHNGQLNTHTVTL